MTTDPASGEAAKDDDELLAIRAMIGKAGGPAQANPPEIASPTRAARKSDRFPAIAAAEPDTAQAEPPAQSAPRSGVLARLARMAWARMRRYRPERKRILLTSLVLLLILQPVAVLGWTLLLVAVLVAVYFGMGGDSFWRWIVSLFQKWERRQPAPARRVKLRAFAFSRKWERYLGYLPDQMADCLRLPELRGLLAADQKHEAALSDRLSRLG